MFDQNHQSYSIKVGDQKLLKIAAYNVEGTVLQQLKMLLLCIWHIIINFITFKLFSHTRTKNRSSHRRCSVRKSVLKNFAKLTEKLLCQSFFFKKVTGYIIQRKVVCILKTYESCRPSKSNIIKCHIEIYKKCAFAVHTFFNKVVDLRQISVKQNNFIYFKKDQCYQTLLWVPTATFLSKAEKISKYQFLDCMLLSCDARVSE